MNSELPNSSPSESSGQPASNRGSRLISRVLPPAVRLWIQAQLDHVEDLEFCLEGRDRQILSGHVPQVSLSAAKAVYEGLHLSQVKAMASEIRINPGQMLRGKPLRLQQPFPVRGHVCLFSEDLRASLHSPLLAQGLQDVLLRLVNAHPALFPEESHIRELIADFSRAPATTEITLNQNQLTLTWQPAQPGGEKVSLATGLQVQVGHLLCLCQPQVTVARVDGNAAAPINLDDFVIDLGPEVEIETLLVRQEFIEMQGMVRVVPGD
jgi:hypothetical protein